MSSLHAPLERGQGRTLGFLHSIPNFCPGAWHKLAPSRLPQYYGVEIGVPAGPKRKIDRSWEGFVPHRHQPPASLPTWLSNEAVLPASCGMRAGFPPNSYPPLKWIRVYHDDQWNARLLICYDLSVRLLRHARSIKSILHTSTIEELSCSLLLGSCSTVIPAISG